MHFALVLKCYFKGIVILAIPFMSETKNNLYIQYDKGGRVFYCKRQIRRWMVTPK